MNNLIDMIYRISVKLLCVLTTLATLGAFAAFGYRIGLEKGSESGYRAGINDGRAQYHNEIINELDQRGGSPLLLYPPDK